MARGGASYRLLRLLALLILLLKLCGDVRHSQVEATRARSSGEGCGHTSAQSSVCQLGTDGNILQWATQLLQPICCL